MGQRIHPARFTRRELTGIVKFPQPEPMLKMFRANSQGDVGRPEAAAITRGPSGLPCPEIHDFFQMSGPILNVSVENRSEHGVLPDVRVERFDQLQDAFMASKPFVKRFVMARAGNVFAARPSQWIR